MGRPKTFTLVELMACKTLQYSKYIYCILLFIVIQSLNIYSKKICILLKKPFFYWTNIKVWIHILKDLITIDNRMQYIYIYIFVEYGNVLHVIWAHQAFKTDSSNWVLNHLRSISISISKMQNMREEREKE